MPKKHPYYNQSAATMAATLLRDWGAKNYIMIIIQPRFLTMTPVTFRQKLRLGLKFLIDSLDNAEHKAYWEDLNAKLTLTEHGENIHLTYKHDVLEARTFEDVDARVNLRADLNAWATSPRLQGDRWPNKLPNFKLNDDDVAHFRQRLIDLAPKGFVGVVTSQTLRFMFAPVE